MNSGLEYPAIVVDSNALERVFGLRSHKCSCTRSCDLVSQVGAHRQSGYERRGKLPEHPIAAEPTDWLANQHRWSSDSLMPFNNRSEGPVGFENRDEAGFLAKNSIGYIL